MHHPVRVIARLDIKGRRLVKGINLEGLRIIGDPIEYLKRYIETGIDEVFILDVNASLYGFEHDYEYLAEISQYVNVPITVGGGVASIDTFEKILNAGADKVSANTIYTKKPEMINELVNFFGSQAVVVYIESKKQVLGSYNDNSYRVYTENGRSRTDLIVEDWVVEVQDRGCGEIVITSVEKEGRQNGFDEELISRIAEITRVPLIISGGYGNSKDLDILETSHIDGIAIAATFHYGQAKVKDIKQILCEIGLEVRSSC
jgi:imidazole glycerol-phosphate synthase subunit HisF